MNVLVVEHDNTVLTAIATLIESWGYHCQASRTGRETIRKVKDTHFDLVLLDVGLHDMSARDLIVRLKENRPDIGIVTMTAESSKELEQEIRTLGIIYYMSKPISEKNLKSILDHIFQRKRGGVMRGRERPSER